MILLAAAGNKHNNGCYLAFTPPAVRLIRVIDQDEVEVCRWSCPAPCHSLRLVRRGAAYRIWVNDTFVGWDAHPFADLTDAGRLTQIHPHQELVGFLGPSPSELRLERIPSFQPCVENPIIAPDPTEPWRAAEAFPGSLLKAKNQYYLYLNGSDTTNRKLEGGGKTLIGLALSTDLVHWQVQPQGPIVPQGAPSRWDSVFMMANGVTVAPDGRYAITYAGFDGQKWGGIGLAFSNSPEDVFTPLEDPVLQPDPGGYDSLAIHEHCLIKTGRQYVLLYTGYNGRGDSGNLAYSEDLVHWTKYDANPVLVPGAEGDWDAWHVRPRGIFEYHGVYYMFYEGASHWRNAFIDSVGMAYSTDLVRWRRCATNPILPPAAGDQYDTILRQWPTPVIFSNTLYVLYAGCRIVGHGKKQGHYGTCLASITLDELESLAR